MVLLTVRCGSLCSVVQNREKKKSEFSVAAYKRSMGTHALPLAVTACVAVHIQPPVLICVHGFGGSPPCRELHFIAEHLLQ